MFCVSHEKEEESVVQLDNKILFSTFPFFIFSLCKNLTLQITLQLKKKESNSDNYRMIN